MLSVMVGLQILSVRQEAQTSDEAVYLTAGVTYWTTGDYRMNPEHPPLEKLISSLPLLPLHLVVRTDTPLWASVGVGGLNEYYYAQDFLYNNRVPWPKILFLGRLPTIALTAVFGLTLALWTRRRAGLWASVIALTLFVFDPTILAHGRYATNDLWVSFFIFVACVLWDAALSPEHSIPFFVAAGLALGCALGTKATAICLPFVFVGVAVARRTTWKRGLTGAASAGLVAVAVLTALDRGSLGSYYAGFVIQFNHFNDGHLAYLFGSRSATGWWYYYPCAFLIKTPLAELFLTALLLFAVIRSGRIPVELAVLIVPIVTYAVICLFSHVDIGVRYLLPIYPLLFALIGIVLSRSLPRWPVVACLVLLAVESLSSFPNYLPFVNAAFGGPDQAPRYLLDSNVDWGQDTRKLEWWLEARGISRICFAYFGAQPRSAFGFTYVDVPATPGPNHANVDCVVAAAVQYLYMHDEVAWLRAYTPIAKIGHSIYVYDFRK
jgi:hypothetical protein